MFKRSYKKCLKAQVFFTLVFVVKQFSSLSK